MDYVILSIVLLFIGIYGLLTKRQLLKVFISIELIATAATLNFIMLASPQGMGEALLVLAFSVDTAISAVILALLVIVSKHYGTSDITKIVAKLKENEVEESEVETQ
ncbi:MAG: NADH-quinone oxidoreductase subunit K [Crenarchaeota archaeon]|jgi:NADH:ubiquinone oxidoreductase subunit K|nr:NADH-quinone oxidoreductase subunit K [Thermoproteota archaeon]